MHLEIDFSPEIESVLAQRAAAEGTDVATYVRTLVAERLAAEPHAATPRQRTTIEFDHSLQEIIELHTPSTGGADDSRESIYAGRCE